jgi:hypothetical protein
MANASQSDTSARVSNRLNRSVLPAWEGFVTSSLEQTCIPLFLVFQSAVTVTLPPNRTAVLKATNLVDDDTNGETDVFVHDRKAGKTERVSKHSNGNEADSWSIDTSISGNGRYVAFESNAGNLVNNNTNGTHDVFQRRVVER